MITETASSQVYSEEGWLKEHWYVPATRIRAPRLLSTGYRQVR